MAYMCATCGKQEGMMATLREEAKAMKDRISGLEELLGTMGMEDGGEKEWFRLRSELAAAKRQSALDLDDYKQVTSMVSWKDRELFLALSTIRDAALFFRGALEHGDMPGTPWSDGAHKMLEKMEAMWAATGR